jgi:hypothetical protein
MYYPKAVVVDEDRMLELRKKNPRRICFKSCHKTAYKKSTSKNDASIFVPFLDSIGPIFRKESGLLLKIKSRYGGFGTYAKTLEDERRIKGFFNKYLNHVFLRDCLSISMALRENKIDGSSTQRTRLGDANFKAKYENCETNRKKISKFVSRQIQEIPFYRDTAIICSIPPSNNISNHASKVCSQVSYFLKINDITSQFKWKSKKPSVKELGVAEKLKKLKQVGIESSFDIGGQNVILIDDMYQSGITMQFFSQILKEHGANKVFGLALVKSRKDSDNVST